jgi:hypothetical protein
MSKNQMPRLSWLPVLHSREEAIVYFAGTCAGPRGSSVAEVNELVVEFIALATRTQRQTGSGHKPRLGAQYEQEGAAAISTLV